jgi:hypothetical protein
MYLRVNSSNIAEIKAGRLKNKMSGSASFAVNTDNEIHQLPKKVRKKRENTETDTSEKKAAAVTWKVNKSKVKEKILQLFSLREAARFSAFITITFPAGMPDNDCYKAFNTWLTDLRKHYGLRTYLWVMERQKNRTVHYHMITINRMPVKKINAAMASAINTTLTHGNGPKFKKDRYNGVDIDNMLYPKKRRQKQPLRQLTVQQRFQKVSSYIRKYITKSTVTSTHRVWHCSRDVSALLTKEFAYNGTPAKWITLFKNNRDKFKISDYEYVTVYYPPFGTDMIQYTDIPECNQIIFDLLNTGT